MPHSRYNENLAVRRVTVACSLLAVLAAGCMNDFGVAPPTRSVVSVEPDWFPLGQGPGVVTVSSLLSAPSGLWALAQDGLYRSTDGGESWQELGTAALPSPILSVASDSSGVLLAGVAAPTALWEYLPLQNSWQQINKGLEFRAVQQIVAGPGTLLFAGTSGWGVFRSLDGGATWSPASAGLPTGDIVLLHRLPAGRLFAATPSNGLYLSDDNGEGWTVAQTGSGNNRVLCITSNSSAMVFVGTAAGLFRSTNGGGFWQQASPLSGETDCRTLLSLGPGRLFAGTRRGVLRSTDEGRTWVDMSEGLVGIQVNTLVPLPNRHLCAGTAQGLFVTRLPLEP